METSLSTNGKHNDARERFSTDDIPPQAAAPPPPKRKKEGVAFDDEIPTVGPEIFILRMKGQRTLTFSVWATKVKGIWVHWLGSHSAPHFRNEQECPGCLKRAQKRWKGFLHCYCYEMRQEVFLELTPASARSLADQLCHNATMRGARIQVKRTTADNGRLFISVLAPMPDGSPLPAEKDPRRSILRLWGISEQDADAWLSSEAGTGEESGFS